MAFDEGEVFEPVSLPEDFITPKPEKGPVFPKRGRKPAGDKADAPAAVKRKVTVPNRKGQFIAPVTGIYMGIGGMLLPFDPVCANAVLSCAEKCAIHWDEMAYTNENVRRFLWSITQVSATSKLFIAHLPILMAIMMHHVPSVQNMLGKMGEQMAETIANQMNANGSGDTPNAD